MDPLLCCEIHVFADKIVKKKSKEYIAAFFQLTALGKPRIELFTGEKSFKNGEVHKTVTLDECISVKPSRTEVGYPYIRLHFKNDSSFIFSCEQLPPVVDVLSSICFPKKYVTIAPSTSLDSPISDYECTDFPETYHVIRIAQVNGREAADGFFSMILADSILLNGSDSTFTIPYGALLWVSSGERCIGFEVENRGIFEFVMVDPLQLVDHLRNFLRFKCHFNTPNVKTVCRYNRHYHPVRNFENLTPSPEKSNNSTMESTGSSINNAGSLSTSSSSADPNSIFNMAKPKRSPNPDEGRRAFTSKINFLRSTSKKRQEVRTDFEEDAQLDFVRLSPPKELPPKMEPLKSSEAMVKFREELERTVLEQKNRGSYHGYQAPRQTDI